MRTYPPRARNSKNSRELLSSTVKPRCRCLARQHWQAVIQGDCDWTYEGYTIEDMRGNRVAG